ncbi:hypothetical protein [Actinotalea ferrariae]|uniref:hypothetical protein n=1 Tax=Actinotalea ferrariae TaxID=1386098 RepID=UPI0012DCF8CF|nr:hypothetical protein [Actinotalea ferrariae]
MTTRGGGLNVRVAWSTGTVGHIAPVIGSTEGNDVYITHIRETAVSGQWITYNQFTAGTAGLGSSYTPTHWVTSY